MTERVRLEAWRATAARDDTSEDDFAVESVEGRLRVRGHLSTGTRGWQLHASAARRRGVITLQVRARETTSARVSDLEFHQYEAVIAGVDTGRYHIRVTHCFLPNDRPAEGLASPVFEKTVTVVPTLAGDRSDRTTEVG